RQAPRHQLARLQGVPPANHPDAPEEFLDLRGGLWLRRTLSRDDPAKEPARPVDTDEPREPLRARLARDRRRNLGKELRAERTSGELRAAALLADLVDDLLPNLVPQPRRPGRGERLHLEGRAGVIETHRDRPLAAFFYFQSKLESFPGNDLHSAQVNVRTDRVGFALVEGSGLGTVSRGRLRLPSRRIRLCPADVVGVAVAQDCSPCIGSR